MFSLVDYKLYVRDINKNRVAEIENYASLTFKSCFNLVGSWSLILPTNTIASSFLVQPGAGIIVVRNGVTVFSGPVNQRERKWSFDDDSLTITGYDDMIFLQNLLAFPNPAHGYAAVGDEYDVRTGPCETVMKQYIDANIGANAPSIRQIDITTESDQGRGNTVTGRARFQTLLDLFGSFVLAGGGLGFKVIQNDSSLQFQVYQPTDKTKSIIFSPFLGNLLDFDYTDTNPQANYIAAGGDGTANNRVFVEAIDSSSIAQYGRIEKFLADNGITSTNELRQAANNEIQQNAFQTNLSITPIDTNSIQFNRDYNLGDKVTVVVSQPSNVINEFINEQELTYFVSTFQPISYPAQTTIKVSETVQIPITLMQDVVREITITIDQNGETVNPTIGTADSITRSKLNIFSKMKTLDRRVTNLERV